MEKTIRNDNNRNKIIKTIRLIKEFIKLKHQGYNKEERYFKYAIDGLITFEQYEKYIDNKIMKGDK